MLNSTMKYFYILFTVCSIVSLGMFGFTSSALAETICEYGLDPATGASGTSCTSTTTCFDTTGGTEPSTVTCDGVFATIGDYPACVYNEGSCTTAGAVNNTIGDLQTYTKKGLLPITPSSRMTSIRNAISAGLATFINN